MALANSGPFTPFSAIAATTFGRTSHGTRSTFGLALWDDNILRAGSVFSPRTPWHPTRSKNFVWFPAPWMRRLYEGLYEPTPPPRFFVVLPKADLIPSLNSILFTSSTSRRLVEL